MPRRNKGARLWLRRDRHDRHGRRVAKATWIIVDGHKHVATRCAEDETATAEARLAAYIAAKYQPARRERDIEAIDIADVLLVYHADRRPALALPEKLDERLSRLNEFWGGRMLADISGATCRDYVTWRSSISGARRELEDLRAAVNHHAKQGFHRGVVVVSLPAKGTQRDRWLSRNEAARLLWACWRARESQKVHRGPRTGQPTETDRRPLRHIARFVLMGLYTGTRAQAITTASILRGAGRSFVDLERGIFYRLADGERPTKKRQPPVPIPPRLWAHMRRWVSQGVVTDFIVEWNGLPVQSVKTGFASAVTAARLSGKVTPHTLRHTAATWLMQAGVDKWEAAGFLGMSLEMLDRVYGHHHSDHLRSAARAIGYRNQREKLVVSLAVTPPPAPDEPQAVEVVGGPGRTRTCNQIVMSDRL